MLNCHMLLFGKGNQGEEGGREGGQRELEMNENPHMGTKQVLASEVKKGRSGRECSLCCVGGREGEREGGREREREDRRWLSTMTYHKIQILTEKNANIATGD